MEEKRIQWILWILLTIHSAAAGGSAAVPVDVGTTSQPHATDKASETIKQDEETQQKPVQKAKEPEKQTEPKEPAAAKEPTKQKTVEPKTEAPSKKEIYNVSAYSLGDSSTPTHGITASGERVQEGRTVACPRELPFGTEVYIPSLDHTYVCTDRGGAIKSGHLDIYFEDIDEALDFGRQHIEVEIKKK